MSEEPKIVFIRKDIPALNKVLDELGDIVTADEVTQIYEHAFQEQIKDSSYPLTVICGNHSDPLHEHMQNNDRYTARQIRF